MANYTQDGRFMAINTALGKDVLLLDIFAGKEAISEPFHFKLGMFATDPTKVAFDKLLGQNVTVKFQQDPPRYFNGIISRLSQGQRAKGLDDGTMLLRFEAELVPQLWLLKKNVQSRIFQQKSVPDILKVVLQGIDTKFQIDGTFEPRDYCVQYRESDFDFASRLMEEEGIYYFFKHADGSHQMIVANTPQNHLAVDGPAEIKYEEIHGGAREDERINVWVKTQEIRTAKQTLRDHCFELPTDNLEAAEPILETVQAGTISHKIKMGVNGTLENYEFPGRYAQRFDGIDPGGNPQASNLQKIYQDNKRTAKIRTQEEAAPGLVIEGESDCRVLTSGFKFTLSDHFDANGAYVLTAIEHKADIAGAYSQAAKADTVYINKFHCIPLALPFRPTRRTHKARVDGTQTAVVVGPSGEEIFTDKYGRVKVQFFWDRQGQNDANSSCWVRVGTLWAGKQWGVIHIPRIGQEVIVAFEEGDPDQPIIVGSVYNADMMPPYELPANKTQSGMKSRSTLKGDAKTFNELRFEDKKGSEEVYFHAEKDFNRVVENNDTLKVGSDKADDGSQTVEVYKDRTESVKTGDEKVTIEKGKRTHSVKMDDSLTVESGNQVINVKTGNRDVKVDAGNDSKKVGAGKSSTEAAQSIELTVGGNSITINQQGITIKGMMVSIEGQATLDAKSPMTTVKGDGMLTLKGGITMIN
jgi:type VI secretion system secreted protein VgrG